jgi:hypothetical protein
MIRTYRDPDYAPIAAGRAVMRAIILFAVAAAIANASYACSPSDFTMSNISFSPQA